MSKLFVFMIDALCSSDIEYMKTLPNFNKIISSGSYVKSLQPCHPALTYCAHTTIVTGCYCDRHGIHNNEKYERSCANGDVWFGMKKDVKMPTLLDYATKAGLTTCSLSWPVSAGANYTYNWPMIVPYHYSGDHPEDYLINGNATQNLLDSYFWKYGRFQKGKDASLDSLTMALAPDIIRDYGQPDVMFVKMCDLDTVRHTYGVYHPYTKDQLKKHDDEFGVLLEAIKRYGDYEDTNFVIIGDHGQTDIVDVLNMNVMFKQAGLIRMKDDGSYDCDCFAHSACLTCFIELKNPEDKEQYDKVYNFLNSLKDDPKIQLDYVLNKKEMKERFHLDGPYDFVIESKNPISFDDDVKAVSPWRSTEPGDHRIGAATHGGSPERKETTLFIASGPSVKKNVVIEKAEMVDEAITMARMISIDMPNTDGVAMEELLCK